eukprot:m.32076 g.32076  ORF g.32076 m.32076 type:complete len:108 (-) comp12120_c0_seq5:198-521(-)
MGDECPIEGRGGVTWDGARPGLQPEPKALRLVSGEGVALELQAVGLLLSLEQWLERRVVGSERVDLEPAAVPVFAVPEQISLLFALSFYCESSAGEPCIAASARQTE